MIDPALAVRGLTARVDGTRLLDDLDLDLAPGRVLAVVGPSGSGKSTLGLGLLGESAPGVTLEGSVAVGGTELLVADPGERRARRAGRVGRLPQHPGAVLDPVRRVGRVLEELAATVHPSRAERSERDAAVGRALARARVPADQGLGRRYPHQLSGGQQQRLALAQTLVTAPGLLVLDEPTTGLDPATTDALVAELAAVAAEGVAMVLLTHDLDVARALAHEAVALRAGRVARRGSPAAVLGVAPAAPEGVDETPVEAARLRVRDLTVRTPDGRALLSGVSVTAAPGQCLGVVGASGAGKTTLARALAGLVAPAAGSVEVDDRVLAPHALDRDRDERRRVQYVHQDPRASFLHRRSVLDQVARPGVLLRGLEPDTARAEAEDLLRRLGVDGDVARRRPGSLSGGQLQRAAVARALTADPAVVVADEVTSALDAGHRAELLVAIDELRARRGTTVVLVSHDLELVGGVAARTVVIDRGRVVDQGPTAAVLARHRGARGARAGDRPATPVRPA